MHAPYWMVSKSARIATLAGVALFLLGAAANAGTAVVTAVDGSRETLTDVADVFTRLPENGGATVVQFADGTRIELHGATVQFEEGDDE